MATFEELFNQFVLSVVAPHASLGLPKQDDALETWSEWLDRLEQETTDRRIAFFDENLDFLLILRFAHSLFLGDEDSHSTADPKKPPVQLLSFLAHLQVSYDASYIAPIREAASSPLNQSARQEISLNDPPAQGPPRSYSIAAISNARLTVTAQTSGRTHPSIFPPHTPHPVPSVAESDRQYVQSQGTPLRSGVWGEGGLLQGTGQKNEPTDAFMLLWSEREKAWTVVFKMSVAVSFMPTKVPDPLLCLTASATLREKPVTETPARKALAALIEAAGGLPQSIDPKSPGGAAGENGEDAMDLTGLEEVNLFEGLTAGTIFDDESSLKLPSTRLGASVRRQLFSLPPLSPAAGSPLPSSSMTPSASRGTHQTLRKSFRKTLQTVSGFRVRMRTVFVPYFMLPQAETRKKRTRRVEGNSALNGHDEDDFDDDALHERELREAGNEEHTVVLCVEVENSGESAQGFAVESVDVKVGGEGAQTRLIGWGESSSTKPESVFPLLIGPEEQYNLLYAVAFMRSPETDEFSLARGRGIAGAPPARKLQRAVSIILNGRPFEEKSGGEDVAKGKSKQDRLTYPTQTFPSRWNCILDLSAQAPQTSIADSGSVPVGRNNALPTPASPFPMSTSRPNMSRPTSAMVQPNARPSTPGSASNTPTSAVAGNKKFTFTAMDINVQSPAATDSVRLRPPPSPMNYRSDTSLLNPTNQRDMLAQSGLQSPTTTTPIGTPNLMGQRTAYIPPSLTVPIQSRGPLTTYSPFASALPSASRPTSFMPAHAQEDSITSPTSYAFDGIPPTPAYPAFPLSPAPPGAPHWQGPISSLQSGEIGPTVEIPREKRQSAPGVPPTPGPRVGAGGAFMQMQMKGEAALRGALSADGPAEPIVVSVGLLRRDNAEGVEAEKIYPLDRFTLDIFVFNRSSWTRRFEISYPDSRKQRKDRLWGDETFRARSEADNPLGIVPIENRVRIGPLLPSTCQSVRMDFLALKPGVHSVDVLTLTDIQSGFTMNLRSVMDVVIHEHEPPQSSHSTP